MKPTNLTFSLIEHVEPRRLLSAPFASLSKAGTLRVEGTAGNDDIRVRYDGADVVAIRNGVERRFSSSHVRRLFLNGRSGSDRLTNDTGLVATLAGDSGDDTLFGGRAADFLRGGFGANYLDGRGGSDVIDYSPEPAGIGPAFHFDLNPPQEHYVLYGINGESSDVPGSVNTVRSRPAIRFLGTDFNDSFGGETDALNPMLARSGFTIDGGRGDDIIGSFFFDHVPGNGVTLIGNSGNDLIEVFSPAVVKVVGGAGDDTVHSGLRERAPDEFDLGTGYDLVDFSGFNFPAAGSSDFHAGPGVEKVIGPNEGPYRLIGNNLNNALIGGGGGVTILGMGGADLIEIPSSTNEPVVRVDGGSGNDTIRVDGSNDTRLAGGDGNDDIELGVARFFFGGTLDGGNGDDILRALGESRPSTLIGGEGNDLLAGGYSDDRMEGGPGNDTLNGNSGNDNLHGGSGADRLFGGSGNDTITGGGGRDLLDGQAGNDWLDARDGLIDTLIGGGGFDRARWDNAPGVRDLTDGIEQLLG